MLFESIPKELLHNVSFTKNTVSLLVSKLV